MVGISFFTIYSELNCRVTNNKISSESSGIKKLEGATIIHLGFRIVIARENRGTGYPVGLNRDSESRDKTETEIPVSVAPNRCSNFSQSIAPYVDKPNVDIAPYVDAFSASEFPFAAFFSAMNCIWAI